MGTVLIVDDDASILSVLHRIIEGEGHIALEAASGVEALQVLEGHDIDVAFIDMVMPEMNGIELMKQVRSGFPNTKVVPMSAYTELRSLPSDCTDGAFLSKPFTIIELRTVLDQALEQRQTGA